MRTVEHDVGPDWNNKDNAEEMQRKEKTAKKMSAEIDQKGKGKDSKTDEKASEKKSVKKMSVHYEYFDPGNHWCRQCNIVSSNVYEVFQHLHSKKHQSVSIFNIKYYVFKLFSITVQSHEKRSTRIF